MSKDRARRRAEREHEAGLRAAARASEQERRERRQARTQAVRGLTGRVRPPTAGKQTGVLAQRRRRQNSMLIAALLALVILVWVVRPDWPARLASLVMVVFAFPVLRTLIFARR